MSKYVALLAICLLAAMFAFGQASQPSQPPPPGQSQAAPQNPQQPPAPGPASNGDRNAASGDTGTSNPAATSNQPTQQPATPRQGGIGWGWIIVAIIVAIIVIGLLARGGSDRVERVERTERDRDRDDIRRAG